MSARGSGRGGRAARRRRRGRPSKPAASASASATYSSSAPSSSGVASSADRVGGVGRSEATCTADDGARTRRGRRPAPPPRAGKPGRRGQRSPLQRPRPVGPARRGRSLPTLALAVRYRHAVRHPVPTASPVEASIPRIRMIVEARRRGQWRRGPSSLPARESTSCPDGQCARIRRPAVSRWLRSRRREGDVATLERFGPTGHDLVVLDEARGRLSLGTSPDNDLVIADDPAVSRVHARLEHVGPAWCITDLGSTNGTTRQRRAAVRARTLVRPRRDPRRPHPPGAARPRRPWRRHDRPAARRRRPAPPASSGCSSSCAGPCCRGRRSRRRRRCGPSPRPCT